MSVVNPANEVLTNLAVARFQDNANQYVFNRVFTPIDVSKTTGDYNVFTIDDIFRDEAKELANGQMAPVIDFGMSSATYSTKEMGVGVPVTEVDATDYADIGDLHEAANRISQTKAMIRAERKFVSTAFTTGVWTTTKQGGVDFTKFSDYASSDPEKVIREYITAMSALTGRRPNKMTIPDNVYEILVGHPSLKSNYLYTTGGNITEKQIAETFRLEEVIVSSSIYHSNKQGGTVTPGFIVPKAILLTYTEKEASIYSESAGYTFQVDGVMGYNQGFRTIVDDTTSKKSDIIECDYRADFKVVTADLGVYLYDVIA